jgi:hypothetical protein
MHCPVAGEGPSQFEKTQHEPTSHEVSMHETSWRIREAEVEMIRGSLVLRVPFFDRRADEAE